MLLPGQNNVSSRCQDPSDIYFEQVLLEVGGWTTSWPMITSISRNLAV